MKSLFSLRAFVAATAIAALSLGTAQAEDKKNVVAKSSPVARAVASAPKLRPLSVSIDLINATRIAGTMTDTTSLEMRTSFGTANIPLSEVAGVRFASAQDATTTVVMLNGDSITGATDVKLVTVETEWGIASINGSNIASVMFVPGLSWNPSSGLNGKRWNLINTKAASKTASAAKPTPAPAPAAAAKSKSTASSTRSTTGSQYQNGRQAYRSR